MKIIKTLESITIQTDDIEIFLELSKRIKKSFVKSIGNKDKIIIFYNENELAQRKYFFKLISNIYSKFSNENIDFLPTEHKDIKLIYKKDNSLQSVLDIDVKFEQKIIIFDLKNSDKLFNRYLIKQLDGMAHEFFEYQNIFRVDVESTNHIEILENLFSTKEHLKFIVNFNINKVKYEEFKKRVKILNSKNYVRRFSMLASLLEEHFKTLGCSVNDDFSTIKTSYLNLTKIYHPDKHVNAPNEIKKDYIDKFQKIGLAYEALKPYFKEQDSFISA